MTSSAFAPCIGRRRAAAYPLVVRYAPIVTIVLALIAIWYIGRDDESFAGARRVWREETPYTVSELIAGT